MSLVGATSLYGQSNGVDIDSIIKKLLSNNLKQDGLNELSDAMAQGCSTASFLKQLDKLFSGLRSCLQVDDSQMETVLKANQIIIDILPDIQHSEDLEIQIAQLVPAMIENLGSSKAVVRKSTHKCIATYVKISKKLEFVLLHLIYSGLESQNTRTRQHSMLVVPALLSLKPALIDRCAPEIMELMKAVIKKLRDTQDIVGKTARKLLIEINKCYPMQFETVITPAFKSDEERQICKAVLRNDEEEIIKVLNQASVNNLGVINRRPNQEESKQQSSYSSNQALNNSSLNIVKGSYVNQSKELSIVGKEILQSNSNQFTGSVQVLDKIINEAKEESRYPKAQNGLYFGILDENLIEALNENNQWKERTNAIEAIESKVNIVLNSDKKVDFIPYSTAFLGFMIQFIPDINFKISLSSIKIISKLLTTNLINFKKYYSQLVAALVEKLSDSKVVIRTSVMKCCALIITNYKPSIFAFHVMRYLQHANWHVREGALHLLAHCVISQQSMKGSNNTSGIPQTPDQDTPLPMNPSLIQEVSQLIESEDKQKNQQYTVDLLALILSKSPEKQKTLHILQKQLSPSLNFKNEDEILNFSGNPTKEFNQLKSIIERLNKGNMPFINEENIVEFPVPLISSNKPSQIPHNMSLKNLNQLQQPPVIQETLATNKTKAPSESFLEMKRKQEEDKKSNQGSNFIQQVNQPGPQQFYQKFAAQNQSQQINENRKESIDSNGNVIKENEKISMWLPSFSNNVPINEKISNPINSSNRNILVNQNQTSNYDQYEQFNGTQSSIKNPLEEQKPYVSTSSINQNSATKNQPLSSKPSISNNYKTPLLKEKPTISSFQSDSRQNSFSQNITLQNQNVSNFDQVKSQGYTPQQHQKNMSQSTGVSGFGVDKGPVVSDRLRLLKTNSKYNNSNSADSSVSPTKYNDNSIFNNQEDIQFNRDLNEKLRNVNELINNKTQNLNGPIRATHKEMMQTINSDENFAQSANVTPNILKNKKPPLTQKTSSSTNLKNQPRAQSVDNSQTPVKNDGVGQSNNDLYQLIEEPLQNPDKQFQQALDQLKSGDWQKQFEACNTIKRICLFHQSLFVLSNPLQQQVVKELVKLVDSLRSQLAKNSILTIKTAIEQSNTRDMDSHVDMILPALVKKAADTNIFIAEAADSALITLCSTLSEQRVFNCLQGIQNVKSNPMKIKMTLCYNTLIDKLGQRIRNSPIMEKLIQAIVQMLNEGAIEVRNMAKIGLLSLKNSLSSQRELEGILNRCVTNEKQMEKIRQILDKGDFDSISVGGSTRYGSSMRATSLDRSSAGPFRHGSAVKQPSVNGSDGFSNYTQSSDFMKGNISASGSNGFGSTANTFKKTNNLVSKPVDPAVMEEFKNIVNEIGTNDWNKRLKAIDTLSDFVKNNQSCIKSAAPGKFIQIIDSFCKVLNDNNIKVLTHAQQNFRIILLNQNLKGLLEQNLTMIVQALNNNLQSANASVRDQGELLFTMLEGAVEPSLLIPPIVAQVNLANNRSKAQLVERLSNIVERCDKPQVVQKYVQPLIQSTNKIQNEAQSNSRLRDALQKLQLSINSVQNDQYYNQQANQPIFNQDRYYS